MRLNSSRLVLTLVFNKPAAVDHFLVSVRLNSSRLVLTLVFNKPAAVDHFLVSVLLLRGRPLAALSEMVDSLTPVSTRALTNLFLVCLFFLPVKCCILMNKIRLNFLYFDFF